MADSLIPTSSSILYRERVGDAMPGVTLNDFYRLFLIPGMGHCRNSAVAPWFIAGGGQGGLNSSHSVPGFMDAKHGKLSSLRSTLSPANFSLDVVLALMAWTENGTAPDSVIATKFKGDSDKNTVVNQRPICAYPSLAKYDGVGNVNASSSWNCVEGSPIGVPSNKLGH
jgi:feruloyl esterase